MENAIQSVDSSPQSLIAIAIRQGVDINQLEKLLQLKERYDAGLANKSFLSAMANFQKDVPTIEKKKLVHYSNRTGGNTSYKFAELGEIDETIKPHMAANGLSKRWEISENGETLICTCIISHLDGHTERTTMSSTKDTSGGKNEIQSRASAISYLQRYTLIGALGLTTASEDNDADGTPPAITQQQPTQSFQQNDDLPWLNYTDKNGNKTSDGIAVENELKSGKTTIEQLRSRFKISKSTAEQLAAIKVVQNPSNISAPDPSTPPMMDNDKLYYKATGDFELMIELIDNATKPALLKTFQAVNDKFFKSNPEMNDRLKKKYNELRATVQTTSQQLNNTKNKNTHNGKD